MPSIRSSGEITSEIAGLLAWSQIAFRSLLLVGLLSGTCIQSVRGQADSVAVSSVKPFPLNRVRHFYYRQAEEMLDSGKIPDLLPQFPGLDGGAFGHWGQNPEDVNFDHTLNSVDTGNVVHQVVNHFGLATNKGVAVHIDDRSKTTVLFDPEKLTFVDSWHGGFVRWGFSRFGVMGGVQADGSRLIDLHTSRWDLPEATETNYRGYYRNGQTVVFSYSVGKAEILDSMSWQTDRLVRTIRVTGERGQKGQLVLLSGNEPISLDAANQKAIVKLDGQASVAVFGTHLPASCQWSAYQNSLVLELKSIPNAVDIQIEYAAVPEAESTPSPVNNTDEGLKALITGGAGQWTDKTIITQGQLGEADGAFAMDTFTVPYAQFNPFGTPMRLCGVGSMSDGRIVVSTILGDVWLITILNEQLDHIRWQRIAAGFYQPLGLIVHEDKVVVLGRDQITRLHDLNGDNEADFYECLTNQYPTTGGHDFCTSLQQDQNHNLYWFTASHNFGVSRLENPFAGSAEKKPTSLATGLRNSNGIGVSPDGKIVFATVQEGTWTPASAIFEVGGHSYHGLNGPADGHGKYGYDLPMCFLPRGVDNSSGELVFLPDDRRLGPLANSIVGTSFGDCSHYLVLREVVNGKPQGGIVPLPGEFLSGVCRLNFNQHDGCLYVAGTEGWQSYAKENGCLQRLRFTGNTAPLPTAIETHANGLLVRFNTEIQAESVKSENIFCQQWNYLYSSAYGSPEYSVKDPGRQAHDHVPIRSVHLLEDHKSVFIEIPELHPVMQFHLHMRLKDTAGKSFVPDLYTSIFELGSQFKEFPGYQLIAKRRAPEFPVPEKFAIDPRLALQDKFGTNFGWVQQAVKLSINAIPGLQYEPRQLRVAPGQKVALTFHNTDPSMPHNIAVVKAAAVDSFAEQAMMLASNPRAIATHYVPEDPAEICFSPILSPEDQYTVFFEAPAEQGEYKIVCTYPGHARVMRASLYVLTEDQPMPELSAEATRKFVRQWSVAELADDADNLRGRSYEQGKAVFAQAGCIK